MRNCNAYFKTFCRISNSMQSTFEMEEVLNLIVNSAVQAMDAKASSLFLKNGQGDVFFPVAQTGLSDAYVHAAPEKAQALTRDILKQGGYLAVKDATSDPRTEHHAGKQSEGIASILVVPVIAEEKPIGTLSLYTAKPRDFDKLDIEFLGALADQGGMAIQKARFIKRKKDNAALLLSITEDLNSSLDIKHILHIMSSEIAEAFNVKGASVRLMDEEKKELKLVASYGLSEAYLNKGPVSAATLSHSLSNTMVCINHHNDKSAIDYLEEKKQEGIVTMLNLPITVKEEVIGILRIYCDEDRKFSEDALTLLRSLARLGGLAIQNASMYLQLQQDKENLEKEIWSHRSWF
ncbi:MAG: GAF domain-containing protein [Desulfobacteraceae bacterium]|nr:GAF domain-containing protein [Desulfobacteraceae bacterium]